MRLVEAAVDRYGPLAGWDPPLTEGLTVVSGPNEAGKTLYLEALVQLLDPAVAEVLDPPPRTEQAPVGRAVVETAEGRHELDGETGLSDVTNVQPVDIPTVFVVRDADLAMPGDAGYYTGLIEHLGEVHTSAIDAVEDQLRELGRLTETNLNVSAQFDDAKPTREAARDLIGDIEAYRREIETEGLDELHRDRLRIERKWQQVTDELEHQRQAEAIQEHERLSTALERYETAASKRADLEGVTRDELETLRELVAERERATQEHREETRRIERLDDEIAATRRELAEVEDEAHELERRSDRLDAVETALQRYRASREAASGADQRRSLGRVGLVAGGLATAGGGVAAAATGATAALGVTVVALVGTLLAGVVAYRAADAVAEVETAAAGAVADAQDAGLEVDTVDDIAPAVEAAHSALERVRDRRIRVETTLEGLRTDREEARESMAEAEATVQDLDEQIDEACTAVGVASPAAFAEAVERRESADERASLARQRLEEALGEAEADSIEERCDTWRRRLEERIADIDTEAVAPTDFDAERQATLTARREELADRRSELEDALAAYDDRLERIGERASAIDASPFIGTTISLSGRSPAALEQLQQDLTALVDAIEADADAARRAVEVLRSIRADQQQRITDLFDPDGPASRAFARITGGRYDHVDFDPDTETLVARTADGQELGVDRLSAGTTDQLYLASRLSLAERLLGGEAGVLLLDDPLVAADADRLERGFEALCRLADDGWQLLYLTAKDEVAKRMVDRFDLPHERVDAID